MQVMPAPTEKSSEPDGTGSKTPSDPAPQPREIVQPSYTLSDFPEVKATWAVEAPGTAPARGCARTTGGTGPWPATLGHHGGGRSRRVPWCAVGVRRMVQGRGNGKAMAPAWDKLAEAATTSPVGA